MTPPIARSRKACLPRSPVTLPILGRKRRFVIRQFRLPPKTEEAAYRRALDLTTSTRRNSTAVSSERARRARGLDRETNIRGGEPNPATLERVRREALNREINQPSWLNLGTGRTSAPPLTCFRTATSATKGFSRALIQKRAR